MGNYLRSILIVVLFIVSLHSIAGHVAGAYIEYKCLGQDSFEVTLHVYKDCKGVSLAAPNLGVEGVGCTYSKSYGMTQISCGDVTPVCKKSCSKCDGSNCNANGYPTGSNPSCTFPYGIEKLVFKKTITFKSTNCCKFRLEYSAYGRSGNITTCCAADNLYIYSELDRCVSPQNSSPQISYEPLSMICKGNCISSNVGALDTINHDSLSYHLTSALNGFGSNCTYQGSYTYQYPLYYDGFPNTKTFDPKTCKGFVLDSITGNLMFKPMQQQVAVVVIEIKEWRRDSNCKAKLIGSMHIDYQLTIVANCTNTPPILSDTTTICGFAGDKICINNILSADSGSKDTVLLSWNHGIPKGSFTTSFPSKSKKQQFDFCWQTTAADSSNIPYYFTAYATDDACPLQGRTMRAYSVTVSKRPDVSRTISYIGCGKIKLQAAPLNQNFCLDIYNYKWYVDGAFYNSKDTIANVKKGGNIYITLAVGINGCTTYFYDSIIVQPFLNIDIGPDTAICKGTSINIKSKVTNGFPPYRYKWLSNANDSLDNYSYLGLQDTDIICKITDSVGCNNFDTIHIAILSLPNFTIYSQQKCFGDTINFHAYNKFNVVNFSWMDLQTGKIVCTQQYYNTNTPQKLLVVGTDKNGCISFDTAITNYLPAINTFAGADKFQCPKAITNMISNGVDSTFWSVLGSKIFFYQGNIYSYSFDSNTTLLLKAIKTVSGFNCVGYDTLNISILPNPIITLPANYYNCKGVITSLIASGQNSYSYKWDTGDTTYYTKASQTGYYKVIATDSNDCIDSATTQLSNFPSQQVSINIYNDTLIASNSNFVLYDWYRNSLFDTSTIVPWLYIKLFGNYSLYAVDSNGCIATSNLLNISTLKSGIYTVPNIDGIKVYPNPSSGIYYIESPVTISDLMIYDLMGRRIYNNTNNLNVLDLSGQPEGIYLLQINKSVWVKLSKQ